MVMQIESFRLALLDEIKLPDFKGRHLFIARLRLIIFVLCWILFVIFYPKIWKISPIVPLIFNIGFLCTSICYWNIARGKYVLSMAAVEVFADVISQTSIIYMLGGDHIVVFIFYGFYVTAAGTFFGYFSALLAATMALISYCGLLLLIYLHVIDPFIYPLSHAMFTGGEFGYVFNLVFLPLGLGIIVYGAKIAHYFSKIKERALETRNVQLLALNRIGSTIRKPLHFDAVIEQVLKGVIQGLGFDVCFLALLAKEDENVHFYFPKDNLYAQKMQKMVGSPLAQLYLPLTAYENSTYKAILKNRVIIRSDMVELTRGVQPAIHEDQSRAIQKELGFKKFVITPLVAERRVMGAIVGASRKSYVEESVIDTLDNFANQVALALESAQLFDELQQKNIQLQKANKIKSDFLAIMSHELRTPLTAIIGYSEILLENVLGDLSQEQKDSLKEVLKNAENLLQLINSILDLAKVEAGKMELDREEFSILDVINEVNQTVTPLVTRKNHKIIINVPDLPPIKADSRKLRQILLNLLGNAIKFTPEGGRIEIMAQYYKKADVLAEEFKIDPKKYADYGVFRIAVTDSGIGITSENLVNIFDIFQQVDSTFTRKYQGTGLGLALTKQLVELHGGVIAVSSEYGEGSEFKFILPERPFEVKEIENI